jgi:nucleoside 2-deoxyribosyltransferase
MLIYFAAPLFSQAERHFNQCLTEKIELIGYEVFLPQRNGVEGNKPPYDKMTKEERRLTMFQVDTTKIIGSDVFLFVLDGRVSDEGACVELGIAYTHKNLQRSNKLLIGLHTDARSAFMGSKLNPMIRVPLEYIATDEEQLLRALDHYKNFQVLDDFVKEVE